MIDQSPKKSESEKDFSVSLKPITKSGQPVLSLEFGDDLDKKHESSISGPKVPPNLHNINKEHESTPIHNKSGSIADHFFSSDQNLINNGPNTNTAFEASLQPELDNVLKKSFGEPHR